MLALFFLHALMVHREVEARKALLLQGAAMWVYHHLPPAPPQAASPTKRTSRRSKTACVYMLHGVRKHTRKSTIVTASTV